jgi:hypothetical protein
MVRLCLAAICCDRAPGWFPKFRAHEAKFYGTLQKFGAFLWTFVEPCFFIGLLYALKVNYLFFGLCGWRYALDAVNTSCA